ncbi:MXAN_6230/SCO0854 family RING domain-containing protein [Nannocystis sp. SCPEA4]|uniref:MXAN_6230/SCO0854 family RING domain-containing protein n=1 Tax=Nannocystis sp. SCPEA4 TaxID=2996787 RepID=UPI00226F7EF4|nr:MXAN_6230/SCO0854 family RING domain-containing protein [Nannocystis sp. SCPEA4]MCY1058819.1 hypothetical protein [Nannocystis sp. SCPEA4]
MEVTFTATRQALLRRHGLVFIAPGAAWASERHLQAIELELAQLGYVLSWRLRQRLATLAPDELALHLRFVAAALAAQVGANVRYTPLFRKFPEDVPKDTSELYLRKVLCHFLQVEGQPCVFCRRVGTTHVLSPCMHVVCDHCFDGENYSACPVCEHHVDRSSPFFKPGRFMARSLPREKVRFKLLDLGEDLPGAAQALVQSFCARKQVMSSVDATDLQAVVGEFGEAALAWLPDKIAVRENVARIFGVLLGKCDAMTTFAVARAHLATATDVLRLLAAYSLADPSLQGETVRRRIERPLEGTAEARWATKLAQLFPGAATTEAPAAATRPAKALHPYKMISVHTYRFKLAPLRRPLRRAILAHLESMHPVGLIEDMLRHRSYWQWVGQFLHPHEYADRFANVARAFAVVRKRAPDGTLAPPFVGFHAAIEAAARAGDAAAMIERLKARPGELGRRFDHALRVAGADPAAQDVVISAFTAAAPRLANPLLLTLHGHLPTRGRPAAVRVFWPKGQVTKGTSAPDRRAPLSPDVIAAAGEAVERELLARFAAKPGFDTCVIDEALRDIVVPFNERTASRAAVSLPRGSRVALPAGKVVRLFLHWCQPEGGRTTDIDLSVAFYDEDWQYIGVCSYYQLTFEDVATSSGDLRSGPFPDGAAEFVDVHRERARARKIRYAVMVVNNYAGMSFSQLERAWAGMMLRDDLGGSHFDARTVELKFDLQGDNGVFMPLVLDVAESTMHWLDVYATGQFALNNVATSNQAITKICPEMIGYFASGVRLSLFELALLHAAARGRRVVLRGVDGLRGFTRDGNESAQQFLRRIRAGERAEAGALPGVDGPPVFAALFRGDVELPAGSVCYALFRERVVAPIAASDLLS